MLLILFIFLQITASTQYPVKILVMGDAGVGKSSLINFMMNKDIAPVCDYESCTKNIHKYKITTYGYKIIFYDSPGFNDLEGGKTNNILFNELKENIKKINIILLCYDISKNRLYKNDLYNQIINEFGENAKKHIIVIYTKANLLKLSHSNINNRSNNYNNYLHGDLPYVITYDNNNDDRWISKLWDKILSHFKFNEYITGGLLQNSMTLNLLNDRINNSPKGCFDILGKIKVLYNNKEYDTTIGSIQIGDNVASLNGFSKVYYIYDHNEYFPVISLKTNSSFISLTNNHILPYYLNNIQYYKKAGLYKIGDIINVNNKYEKIIEISNTNAKVRYILTENNFIRINNILSSVHVDDHNIGYYMTFPLRYLNNIIPNIISNIYFVNIMNYIYSKVIYLFLN